MRIEILPARALVGEVSLPGDKSISHRALLLGSIATGTTIIRGLLRGEDVLATMRNLRVLGVSIDDDGDVVRVQGVKRFQQPETELDCGNSGTTMRLMMGLLASEDIVVTFTGDASLSRRPMRRVTRYLEQFGITVRGQENGNLAPITYRGRSDIPAFEIEIPMASAQVKSALALMALRSCGGVVRGGGQSRDHTERMIEAMGGSCTVDLTGDITVGTTGLMGIELDVPGDISSAAFLIVAGLIVPNSRIVMRRVGVNPTRTGLLTTLIEMGADIRIENQHKVGTEDVADLVVSSAPLRGVVVPPERVVTMIDEIPILSVAATQAEGQTVVTGAKELRKKESDRLESSAAMLMALGGEMDLTDDGFVVTGKQHLRGGLVDCRHDHRIAMSAAVAALVCQGATTIKDASSIATSFPNFWRMLQELGVQHHRD